MGNICRKDPLLVTEHYENHLKVSKFECINIYPCSMESEKCSELKIQNIFSIECKSKYYDLKFECNAIKSKINDLIEQSKILQASLGEIGVKIKNSESEIKILKENSRNLAKENIEVTKLLKSKELSADEANTEFLIQKAEKSKYEVKILKCEIEKYKETTKQTEIKLKELKDSEDYHNFLTLQDLKSEIDYYEWKINETELENLEIEKRINLWNNEINCIGL